LIFTFVPSAARAQAPPAALLVLQVPPSARPASLAGAWVTGRDSDVLFYNPAQLIGARAGFNFSFTQHGSASRSASVASISTGGKWSLTLGWGAQFLTFDAPDAAPYPFTPDVLIGGVSSNAFSAQLGVGGAIVYKNLRIGAVGKYATDRFAATGAHAFLVDVGAARNLFGGVVAGSVQNLGRGSANGARVDVPRQVLVGYSIGRPVGEFDVALFTQTTFRKDWTSPAAGVDLGYSWIEGYSVAVRAGVMRPAIDAQKPFTLGGALTADRLTIEYGLQFFDAGRKSHVVTVRWQ
jgi:hypothetical protein